MNEAASETGDVGLQAHAIVLGLWIRLFTNPEGWAAEAERAAQARSTRSSGLGRRARGLARAWSLLGLVHLMDAQFRAGRGGVASGRRACAAAPATAATRWRACHGCR